MMKRKVVIISEEEWALAMKCGLGIRRFRILVLSVVLSIQVTEQFTLTSRGPGFLICKVNELDQVIVKVSSVRKKKEANILLDNKTTLGERWKTNSNRSGMSQVEFIVIIAIRLAVISLQVIWKPSTPQFYFKVESFFQSLLSRLFFYLLYSMCTLCCFALVLGWAPYLSLCPEHYFS